MDKEEEEEFFETAVAAAKKAANSDVPAEEVEDNVDSEKENENDSCSSSESDTDSDSDSEFECEICEKKISSYLSFKQHLKGKKHAKALSRKKKIKKLEKEDTVTGSDDEVLLQELYAECKICKKEFYGPESYRMHLKSKKHKQKSSVASILNQVQEDGKVNVEKLKDLCRSEQKVGDALEHSEEKIATLALEEEDDSADENQFECDKCEKQFSGLIPFTQHLTSKSHAKKVGQKNLLQKVVSESSKDAKVSTKSKQKDISTLCVEDDILVCKICTTSFSGPENAFTHMKSKKHAKKLEKYFRKLEIKKKKKAEDIDINSEKGIDKPEKEEEKTIEKIQPTTVDSGNSDPGQSSSSSDKQENSFIAYEKYKEYKEVMNSIKDNEMQE